MRLKEQFKTKGTHCDNKFNNKLYILLNLIYNYNWLLKFQICKIVNNYKCNTHH